MPQSLPGTTGICSYEEAAHLGMDVDETVTRLVRYAWMNRRLMDYGLYWINPTPEWEVKEALSLHTYLCTEHAALMRKRVSEMRNPPPRMDIAPDAALERFLDEILAAQTTLEKLVAVYGVLRPALLRAYREHYEAAHKLVDYPTRRRRPRLRHQRPRLSQCDTADVSTNVTRTIHDPLGILTQQRPDASWRLCDGQPG
jgi:hypothetical protein